MKIAFTDSRSGLTIDQRIALRHWVAEHVPDDSHLWHGACVGADEEFVAIFSDLVAGAILHALPGHLPPLTSVRAMALSHVRCLPEDCLVRNRRIVDAGEVLLACPDGPERLRSGTWSTVRYARKTGKRVVLFMPDGSTLEDS